jgi:hypothetical protein
MTHTDHRYTEVTPVIRHKFAIWLPDLYPPALTDS